MREFLEKWKKYLVFAALLSCFINILQLTFAFYMFAIYRSIVASYSESSLYTITVIALYALLCMVFFNYMRIKLLNRAGTDLNRSLGDRVFSHILRGMALPARRAYSQGISDLDTLRNYFNNQGIYALFDAPWAPLYLLLVYFFHPVLGIAATAGAAVILGLSILQDRLTRNRLAEANMRNSQNRRLVDLVLRNAEVINSMGMREDICRRWNSQNDAVIGRQTAASRYAGTLQSFTRPFQVLMQVLMYGIGAYYALLGQLDVGIMVAASIIMGQAVGPVMRAMASWRFTVQARGSYQRLRQFCDWIEAQPQKMELPAPSGRIDAQGIFLRIGQHTLLQNVSFSLAPGEMMGVIGPSGAGKSTLCRIILGIWPSLGGRIRLDGVDLFYWDQAQLGGHMGYLAQEVELFDATVARNIARMDEPDQEKVRRAAGLLGMEEWISSLPEGYETRLDSSSGVKLSGGQRQRIGLARAVYGDPGVLVLDEPDSNLDTEGEASLTRLLKQIKKDRSATCILVTHKPEIVEAMDKILVLKEGRAVQFGTPAEVFRQLMSSRQAV